MTASVIIPVYNDLENLKAVLDSLEDQDCGDDFEVVVCDDGSTDGTGQFLDVYRGELNLKVVHHPVNRGRAAARNSAAKSASGDILILLDGDMVAPKHFVSGHVSRHLAGDLVIVVGAVRFDRSLGQAAYVRYLETRGGAKLSPGTSLPGRYFVSANASLTRRLFFDLNGFSEDFVRYGGEDLDFGLRAVKAGTRLVYAPELAVVHLHLRRLLQALSAVRDYGRYNLPILLRRHPELHMELHLDWLDCPGPARLVRSALLSPPVYWVALLWAKMGLSWRVPSKLLDYLVFRNYFSGFVESQSKSSAS